MTTEAERHAIVAPERFAFTEYDARCVLLSYALRGLIASDGLPELLSELTAGGDSMSLAAMLGHADRLTTEQPQIVLGERAQMAHVVRVSPWIPGPRRRAVALWLREQD
jgi:hypothetical protein